MARLKCATMAFGIAFGVLTFGSASAQPLQEVAIGLGSSSFAGGSARIVKELGLFEKHGLDAKIVIMDSGNVSLAALLAKSYKVVVCGLDEVITAKARGQDVMAVVPTYMGLGVNLVLSKDVASKLNVSQTATVNDRLKALDGLRIATASPNNVATIALKIGTEAVGANVRFAALTYPAMLPALSNSSIDGFIAAAPFWAIGIVSGKASQWINLKTEFSATVVPPTSAVLATRRDVADAEPDLVKKVAAAFADLGKAVEERPNEVRAAIAKFYPDLDGSTMNLLFDAEATSWKSAPVTAEQVSRHISILKTSGLAPPEIEKIVPSTMLFF